MTMLFRKPRRPTITREQSLAMRPVRMVDAELAVDPAGNGKLAVPVQPSRLASWVVNRVERRTKTFEFDAVGVYVWEQIDGKTSVEQLIRRIGKQYNLDLRQAEASTTAFLKTLMQRGLVGMPVKKEVE